MSICFYNRLYMNLFIASLVPRNMNTEAHLAERRVRARKVHVTIGYNRRPTKFLNHYFLNKNFPP